MVEIVRYREFSYPFLTKKILRGGSWAIPSYMINIKYRNAQMPDMRFQFTEQYKRY